MSAEEAVTQEVLASLLSSLAATKESEGPRGRARPASRRVHEARVHDFARSEALPRATVQGLEGVYATFARAAASSLSAYLRTPFQMSLLSLDQLTYDQFVRSVPDPTVIAVFSMKPLPGKAILELNPAICFWIADRMLGGEGGIVEKPRPLTDMEKALLEGAVSRLLGELGAACESLIHVEPDLVEVLDAARAAEIAKPADPVGVASFEVTVGSLTGMASICLPAMSLKLGGVVVGPSGDVRGDRSPGAGPPLGSGLEAALSSLPVSCAVRLGGVAISAAELAELEEGDVLCLDRRVEEDWDIFVAGVPKFRGRPVRSGEKLALEIVS